MFTRRAYVERWTPAEKAIRDACHLVEGVGAHPLLTEVVVLLQEAFNRLADYTDAQIEERS